MYAKCRSSRHAACEMSEFSVPVPVELVKKTPGLSMDLGGSVLKFVFRSKENLDEASDATRTMGHLQFVSFAKSDLHPALDYVKDRCVITRSEGRTPEIYTTGVECTLSGKTLCEKFDIRLKNLTEFDCFCQGFTYLSSRLSRKDLLHPYDDDAAIEPIETIKGQVAMMRSVHDDGHSESLKSFNVEPDFSSSLGKVVNDSDAPVDEAEDIYPCILAVLGSGFASSLIQKDKTFRVIDGSNRGGRAFYGMGSILTGCKSYDELVELASRGNQKNVDVFSDSLFSNASAAEGDASIYAQAGKSDSAALVFCFGKAVGAKTEDFRREDLARAWLNYVILDTVQCLTLLAHLQKVKRIFLSGSFCNSSFVRGIFSTEMVRRNILGNSFGFPPVEFDFIRPGAYLGAFGALVSEAMDSDTSK